MSATGKLIQSLKAENYIDAKKHFTELVADKMRNVLTKEYRDVSRSFVKEDVTQTGPDPATVNESEEAKSESVDVNVNGKWYTVRTCWCGKKQCQVCDGGHGPNQDIFDIHGNVVYGDARSAVMKKFRQLKGKLDETQEVSSNPVSNASSDTKSPEELLRMIKAGDTVTISFPKRPGDKVPQTGRGKAVMPSKHGGWVLNMGGAYGKPGIADEDNIVSFRRNGGKPVVARRG